MSQTGSSSAPRLFQPVALRGVALRNRIVIAPMCQYSAEDGKVTDWHFVHLGAMARGGAGLVFVEATGVTPEGRITHGCPGIWSDAHADALRPLAREIKAHGAVPGIQLAHAGRKASAQRPWEGGAPLTQADAARGDAPWPTLGPSALPLSDDWPAPRAASLDDIADLTRAFADAARRADKAGFEALELHGAHGYLIHAFLSPISNQRTDAYGGSLENRMRFALDVAAATRAAWPDDKPLFFRISAVDGIEGGWSLDDSVALARELKARGVDVIDCSSLGNGPVSPVLAGLSRGLGYQLPYAKRVRAEAGIMTQGVGLILDGPQAEAALAAGDCDLIAIARAALDDPFWPLHQAQAMGADPDFAMWPTQYGFHLSRRAGALTRLKSAAE